MVVNGFKLSSSIPILPFKKTWKQKLALKLVVSTIMWIILGHFSQICGLPTVTLHQLGIVYRPYPPSRLARTIESICWLAFKESSQCHQLPMQCPNPRRLVPEKKISQDYDCNWGMKVPFYLQNFRRHYFCPFLEPKRVSTIFSLKMYVLLWKIFDEINW